MRKLAYFILGALGIILLSFLIMLVLIYSTAARDTAQNADAIVVLGAAQYDGVPSPVFQARLDHAYDLFMQNRAPKIILSGGKQLGDMYSEAASGKMYLTSRGIVQDVFYLDENSFSTKQNIDRVHEIAEAHSIETFIIVSDPFHMFRALTIAHDLGLSAKGSPTRTSPINQNGWLEFEFVIREAFLTFAHILFDV